MGRDWYWVSGGSSKSSSNSKKGERDTTTTTTTTAPSGCMSYVFNFFHFHHFHFPLNHHSSYTSSSSLHQESISVPKGVEAPRNSLETITMEETSTHKEEESLNISLGIHIKTRTKGGISLSNIDSSTEISYSPGAKTPNLVARLMGLDLLPDHITSSPSSSSTSTLGTPNLQPKPKHCRPCKQTIHTKQISCSHRHSVDGDIRGTTKISSARRSDVEHRLSLQYCKENEDLEFSRFSFLRRKEFKVEDENRSPGEYVKQIVKQVKENANRKVGMDITNTIRNREQTKEKNGHDLVNQLKSKRNPKALTNVVMGAVHDESRHSASSCSPRLTRFLEPKSKPNNTTSTISHPFQTSLPSTDKQIPLKQQPQPFQISLPIPKTADSAQPQYCKVSAKPKLQPLQDQHQQIYHKPIKKCKKAENERFNSKMTKPSQTSAVIRNKLEEPFVKPSTINRATRSPDNKKCKKTPLSNEFLNNNGVSSLFPIRKDQSLPTMKLNQKQVIAAQKPKQISESSCRSGQTYGKEAMDMCIALNKDIKERYKGDATSTTTAYREEYEYITRILRRTGINKETPLSFTTWFSPSHPLNPSIFNNLEPYYFTTATCKKGFGFQLGFRSNRKLLFELVDEILIDFLKPNLSMKPWANSINRRDYYNGSELIDWLCSKIESYPSADCHVLEDIDALIDMDLPETQGMEGVAFEEEGEGIVAEIENDIVDTLLHETAVEFGFRTVALLERKDSVLRLGLQTRLTRPTRPEVPLHKGSIKHHGF